MTKVSYNRTFVLQASHFNGKKQYEVYYRLRDMLTVSNDDVLDLIKEIHGHNFSVVVDIALDDEGDSDLDAEGFVVDDEQLEALIRRYDRQNISVHKDFADNGERATTELMAQNYARMIFAQFDPMRTRIQKVSVRVHETDEIFATATVWA